MVQWQIDGCDGTTPVPFGHMTGDFHLNSDGTAVLVGSRAVSGNGNGTLTTSKWDLSDQSFVWGEDLLGIFYDFANGGFPIAGWSIAVDSNDDLWLAGEDEVVKIDQDGNILVGPVSRPDMLYSRFCEVDSEDSIIFCYQKDGIIKQNRVAKVDSSGTLLWDKRPNSRECIYFVLDSSDNMYFAHQVPGSSKLVKADTDGDLVWEADDYEYYNAVAIDGSYVYVVSDHGSLSFYVDKYDHSGNYVSSFAVSQYSDNRMIADGSGGVYLEKSNQRQIEHYNSSGTLVQTFTYDSSKVIRSFFQVGTDLYVCGDRVEVTP